MPSNQIPGQAFDRPLIQAQNASRNRPAILFADEPTGNPDSVNGEQILLLLREIQSTLGMTIIMVTHERSLVEPFANRIAVLSDGRLVSDTFRRAEAQRLQSGEPGEAFGANS